jgi:hypothetical protein
LKVSQGRGISWEGPDIYFQTSDDQLEILSDLRIEYGSMVDGRWTPVAGPDAALRTTTFVVSGTRTRLTDRPEWISAGDLPRGSPDGSRVATVGVRMDLGAYWWILSGPNWLPEPLAPEILDGEVLGWTADATSLYWREGDDVYSWPLNGGEKSLLLTLPPGLRDCEPSKGEMAEPEFYCATWEYESKLFLVENFDPDLH